MRSALAAAVLLLLPSAAAAQAGPTVTVALGPAVQARAGDLGPDALEDQRLALQREVQQALAHARTAVRQVDLAIVDLQPTRPTSAQLGRSTQLSKGASVGLGGAAITGTMVEADGSIHPIRFRFFQSDLRNELGFTTWSDADDAFDKLAHDLARGKAPDDERSWPPPHAPEIPTGTRLPG